MNDDDVAIDAVKIYYCYYYYFHYYFYYYYYIINGTAAIGTTSSWGSCSFSCSSCCDFQLSQKLLDNFFFLILRVAFKCH